MKTLPINLEKFSFYTRESQQGKRLKNKCGRDFLYYALVYFKPEIFGNNKITPLEIDRNHYFGIPVPAWLAWTQIQFFSVARYLHQLGASMHINKNHIKSFFDFVWSILFSRISYDDVIVLIEKSIDENRAVGLDIPIAYGGLLDHVMFVYGYDEENLYVFDTIVAPLNYTPISDTFPQVMKLPKSEVKKDGQGLGEYGK